MHCPSCGFENPEGLRFCNECGTPFRMPCAQCGFANQPQAKFCGGCGAALSPRPQASIERTEGNPFFLEESVRTLVETGALVGEGRAYRLSKPMQSIQMPATVQVVLAARIDRLTSEEKHLLQTAAVIGTDVPLSLLLGVAEMPEDTFHTSLS